MECYFNYEMLYLNSSALLNSAHDCSLIFPESQDNPIVHRPKNNEFKGLVNVNVCALLKLTT